MTTSSSLPFRIRKEIEERRARVILLQNSGHDVLSAVLDRVALDLSLRGPERLSGTASKLLKSLPAMSAALASGHGISREEADSVVRNHRDSDWGIMLSSSGFNPSEWTEDVMLSRVNAVTLAADALSPGAFTERVSEQRPFKPYFGSALIARYDDRDVLIRQDLNDENIIAAGETLRRFYDNGEGENEAMRVLGRLRHEIGTEPPLSLFAENYWGKVLREFELTGPDSPELV